MAATNLGPLRGYIEGYYGRLPSWQERLQLLDSIAAFAHPVYLYAPKEDVHHRFEWRKPYDAEWRQAFCEFCNAAVARSVSVMAGIAPGLDFDYQHLNGGPDFDTLLAKAQQLLADGAAGIVLLLDDIALDLHSGTSLSEGAAHGTLGNVLADALQQPVWLVPRVYAKELSLDSEHYLTDLAATLDEQNALMVCGSHIVAHSLNATSRPVEFSQTRHDVYYWDNRYANDYCPRRLFVPAWQHRDPTLPILVNPTGMILTDCCIMDLVRNTEKALVDTDIAMHAQVAHRVWQQTLDHHGVPDAFEVVAMNFAEPHYTDSEPIDVRPSQDQLDALEILLWQWKGALAREWYPYLMGLRHDLLTALDMHPDERLYKTQLPPFAQTLVHSRSNKLR